MDTLNHLRILLIGLLMLVARRDVLAQNVPANDSIAVKLAGCWLAGDGGTKARYCFSEDGLLAIAPLGRGREQMLREWSVDKNGSVVVKSGKHSIVYVVEHLAADGFVLVNDKEHVRLEGHLEPAKR